MRKVFLILIVAGSVSLDAQVPPEADARNFERVIIPVWAQSTIAGAYNSIWTSELWVRNESDQDAYLLQSEPTCVACNPDEVFKVRAHSTRKYRHNDFFGNTFGGSGIHLYVEKGRKVYFSLRVRDISREALSAGTEIPVVNQHEGSGKRIVLLGIPSDERFRSSLRIYPLTRGTGRRARVRLLAEDSNVAIVDRQVDLGGEPDPAIMTPYPVSADLLDLTRSFPAVSRTEEFRVEITPESPGLRIWAFVAVTNNDTQQVTTISPQ